MIFTILALALALYVVQAVLRGEVHAKDGAWGKTISREESPGDFWMAILIYSGLAIALVTLF